MSDFDYQKDLSRNVAEQYVIDFMERHNLENLSTNKRVYKFDFKGELVTLNVPYGCFAIKGRQAYGVRDESGYVMVKLDLEALEKA